MPKFELECVIGVSAHTVVRARTLTEAIEIATGREARHAMSGDADENECWVVEELDGAPQDICKA